MGNCKLIKSEEASVELEGMIENFIEGYGDTVKLVDLNESFHNQYFMDSHIVIAVEVNAIGSCVSLEKLFLALKQKYSDAFKGSIGTLIVRSSNDLYTKSISRQYLNLTNKMGLSFLGHGVVEAVGGFKNYLTWQKTIDKGLEEICFELCHKLGVRLKDSKVIDYDNPNILVLHASSNLISNTLMLWNKAKAYLPNGEINELHVENGTVVDCKGCSFKTCVHFSEHKSCFYGGELVDEILPAIEKADIIVWVCPNYNDSISAKLMAVINRMTVLYRRIEFYNKKIYAVIVSGNSGSDSVEEQLIGSLVINKGFHLPGNFALLEIANDPGSIKSVVTVEHDAKLFGQHIK